MGLQKILDKPWMPTLIRARRKPTGDKNWQVPMADFNEVSLESLKIFQQQAEKYLEDSLKTADVIAARVVTLISLCTALIIASLGYIVQPDLEPHLFAMGETIFFYAWVCLGLLAWFGLSGYYSANGIIPSDLVYNEFFVGDNSNNLPEKSIYKFILERYQQRAVSNRVENWKRWRLVNFVTFLLFLLPILLVPGYCCRCPISF